MVRLGEFCQLYFELFDCFHWCIRYSYNMLFIFDGINGETCRNLYILIILYMYRLILGYDQKLSTLLIWHTTALLLYVYLRADWREVSLISSAFLVNLDGSPFFLRAPIPALPLR